MFVLGLIVLIILISVYVIFHHYKLEEFTDKQYVLDRDVIPQQSAYIPQLSIEVPIPDAYLTHTFDIGDTQIDNIYDYKIIHLFRTILDRPPTDKEITSNRFKFITGEQDEQFLKMVLYNTTEYVQMKDTQINANEHELEHNVYRKMLYDLISNIYTKYHDRKIFDDMLPHLRDVLIHFQFDMYLFIAFISSKKYIGFEKEVLDTEIINKYRLRTILYNHYILLQLHNDANAVKEHDLKDGSSNILNEVFNAQKIRMNKNRQEEKKILEEDAKRKLRLHSQSKQCKFPKRVQKKVYNPISHNMPYRTNIAHNPPICTTIGEKPLDVLPADKPINNGQTSLDEAKTRTQVGSIMPKFNYTEYVQY